MPFARTIVVLFAIAGALLGGNIVALAAAIAYGNSGPWWPFIPLTVMAVVGAFVGARFARKLVA